MTVNKYLMPLLVIASLFVSVVIAKAAGVWSISGKQLLDVQQLSSGDEVRGWMTFRQLSDGYGIPQETLYTLLGIPPDVPVETALKDMESVLPDFEVSVVREVITTYLEQGQPSESPKDGDTTLTPVPNATINQIGSISDGEFTKDQTTEPSSQGGSVGAGPTAIPAGQILPGAEIKGRHTLQDIVDQCNIPASDLLAAFYLSPDVDMSTLVKDLVAQGLIADVQNVRDIVSAIQNR